MESPIRADKRVPAVEGERTKALLLPALSRWIVSTTLVAGVLLVSSGRFDLPLVWAYLAVYSASQLAISLSIARGGSRLLRERRQPGPGAKRWDRLWLALFSLPTCALFVIAGLDVGRFHWADSVPLGLQVAGLVGGAASFALVGWAVATNAFFSKVVRVQRDRGHSVVTSGPYRYVRHPAYAGSLVWWPCSALALGSWWAVLPALVTVLMYIIRTGLEDRTLVEELDGYREYAARVRYRLLPGIW